MSESYDNKQLIAFWVNHAEEDFLTMQAMVAAKRYSWSLFIGHLVIEKYLKALYLKRNDRFPPNTHNLLRLAEEANIIISNDLRLFLVNVTAFNISGRYDDYKESFKKKCTPEFTLTWVEHITAKKIWIKELINQ